MIRFDEADLVQPGETADALFDIHAILQSAQAVLADSDSDVAITECLRLLRQVEDRLNSVAADHTDDGPLWRSVRGLRDDIAGYVLATETLQDVGVKPTAVLALLHRGVALVNSIV